MPTRCLLFDKIERIRKGKVLKLRVIGLLKPSKIWFLGGTQVGEFFDESWVLQMLRIHGLHPEEVDIILQMYSAALSVIDIP